MTTTPKGSDGEQETFFQVNEPTGSSLLQDDARARILLSDIQLGNIASSNAKCDGAIYPRSKVFWSTATLYETSMLCLSLLLGLHLD
ncbi:hypothetical protein L914_10210 [Phytophthora nicotianae]|uniref:Uncharacterized protein n=1 Tax=Phytophthora nicotianae TaxID=4792 RepID=W2N9I4_PHYNI|nr:hypothetical protein L914_10210 [Phytophthora nicotianae]